MEPDVSVGNQRVVPDSSCGGPRRSREQREGEDARPGGWWWFACTGVWGYEGHQGPQGISVESFEWGGSSGGIRQIRA